MGQGSTVDKSRSIRWQAKVRRFAELQQVTPPMKCCSLDVEYETEGLRLED